MAIGAIPPIGGFDAAAGAGRVGTPGSPQVGGADRIGGGQDFGETLRKGIEAVSNAEHSADEVAQSIATGGPAEIHDLMVATSKASLSVDLLVQVRNRAVEAYQEIMRMQV